MLWLICRWDVCSASCKWEQWLLAYNLKKLHISRQFTFKDPDQKLTFVVKDGDVFVSRVVEIVVLVSYDDGQGAGASHAWISRVLHDDRHVVLLLRLPVKFGLADHYPSGIACI